MTGCDRIAGDGRTTPRFYGPAGMALTVAAVTVLRLAYLTVFPFDLHPDEAQYWSWSLEPAWGYFSKPPMVAWLIAATTSVCGPAEACIKLSAPILHGLTACFIYGSASRLYGRRAGFFGGILYLTLPGVSFSSAIMSTDPPLLTFWSIALYALVRLREAAGRTYGWWLVLGLAVGLGLLSKYAMGFFVLALTLWLVLDREGRRGLLADVSGRAGLMLASVTALALFVPNLWWNVTTGFVTFAHTASNANLGAKLFRPDKLADFIVGQFGVFGPVLFAVLLWLLLRPGRWRLEPRARMLAAFVLAVLVPILIQSFISRANANWAATAYVAGAVWVAGYLSTVRWGQAAAMGSVVLHVAAAGLVMGGGIGQKEPGRYWGVAVASRIDPFKLYGGWRAFGNEIAELRTRYPGLPLLAYDRMTVAFLLYYAPPRPVPVYAWHQRQRIDDHFQLTRPWTGMEGRDALVIARRGSPDKVLERFRGHRLVGTISQPVSTESRRRIRVFHASEFLGYKRAQP